MSRRENREGSRGSSPGSEKGEGLTLQRRVLGMGQRNATDLDSFVGEKFGSYQLWSF